ncbi:MAG TPA: carboxypeptidase-like regulatory domain-containing protein [Candidatus Angelobacter sp.]
MFLALVLIVASGFTSPQPRHRPAGEIRGVVTDRDGRPISSAMVFAVPQALTLEAVTPRSAKTGEDGKFVFRGHFNPGSYTLYSRKEEEGYTDPTDRFYADSRAETEVHLTADKPSATVEVRLVQKAGILEGRVIDVNTGADILARLVFYDQNGNQHFLMAKGKYRALLPPGKDIGLMVSSPKYESRVAVARLQLEPGAASAFGHSTVERMSHILRGICACVIRV